ncbi:Uncharacterised protein [Klebsiella pneumoniae]|nr:Uncharacterised protein [Klebsiella pneumoniae]
MGKAFITRDGEALEGEALDDVVVLGIVTFVINRTSRNDDECPVYIKLSKYVYIYEYMKGFCFALFSNKYITYIIY